MKSACVAEIIRECFLLRGNTSICAVGKTHKESLDFGTIQKMVQGEHGTKGITENMHKEDGNHSKDKRMD